MEVLKVKVLMIGSDVAPFDEWYGTIKDTKVRQAIASRILRVRQGNFGYHRKLKEGVCELKIDLGPGYRVYYVQHGKTLVILLGGGSKRDQENDIKNAVKLWRTYGNEIERYCRDV